MKRLLGQFKQLIVISSGKQLSLEIKSAFKNKHNRNKKNYQMEELQVVQIKTILSNLQIISNKY